MGITLKKVNMKTSFDKIYHLVIIMPTESILQEIISQDPFKRQILQGKLQFTRKNYNYTFSLLLWGKFFVHFYDTPTFE